MKSIHTLYIYVCHIHYVCYIYFIYIMIYIFTEEGRSLHPFCQRNELFYSLKWWHHNHYYHLLKKPSSWITPQKREVFRFSSILIPTLLPYLCPHREAQVCLRWGMFSSFSYHLCCFVQTHFLICFNIFGGINDTFCAEKNGLWSERCWLDGYSGPFLPWHFISTQWPYDFSSQSVWLHALPSVCPGYLHIYTSAVRQWLYTNLMLEDCGHLITTRTIGEKLPPHPIRYILSMRLLI